MNTETATATAAAPVAPTKKKQHTITVTEADKNFLNDLQLEFHGPQASNPDAPRYLSTEEAFNVLLTVATDNRFTSEQATDENGELVFDEDGEPEMVTVDLFEVAAKALIEARGIRAKSVKVVMLQAQLEALRAELEAVKAAKGEPVEA